MNDFFGTDDENKAIFMVQFYSTRLREAFEAMAIDQLGECFEDLSIWPMWLFTRFPTDVIEIVEKLSQFEVDDGKYLCFPHGLCLYFRHFEGGGSHPEASLGTAPEGCRIPQEPSTQ